MSSSITARRIEEDDDGTSKTIGLEWTIPRVAAIVAKCRPRQRMSSQEFHIYNCSGYNVRGKVIFFPKGLEGDAAAAAAGDSSSSGGGFRPSLGVELLHVRRSNRLDVATPIAVRAECFDVDGEQPAGSSDGGIENGGGVRLGEAVALEVWRHTGETSAQGPLAVPGAVTFQALQAVRHALLIVISLTFPRHDRDAGGGDDDDDDNEGMDVGGGFDALDGVKHRLSTLQERMAGLLTASPTATARGIAGGGSASHHRRDDSGRSTTGSEAQFSERTPQWEPVFARLLSDAGPDEWRDASQAWVILVHAVLDVPETFVASSVDARAEAALEAWPKPAPGLVTAALAWCPPLRRRLTELVPLALTFSAFWIRLVVVLEGFAACGPVPSGLHAAHARRMSNVATSSSSATGDPPKPHAATLSAGSAFDLCAFALPASTSKSYALLQVGTPTVQMHLALLEELGTVTAHSDEAYRRHALHEMLGKLESLDDMWRDQIDAYALSQEAMLAVARAVCEKGEWSMPARLCLAQAEHTCANVASNVSEMTSDILAATKGLLAALGE